METFSLVTLLRTNQLHRSEIKLLKANNDRVESESQRLTNCRRSRLSHFHICMVSDQFDFNNDSYVGLLIFSYDNQSKFLLNGHYCQRGDIIIKRMSFFNSTQTMHRGIYHALFKWYFGRSIDDKFFGIGFLCFNKTWRFNLFSCNDRNLFLYEYRILDMFMLTHWLTQSIVPCNVQEMEIIAKDLLLKQYDVTKKRLINQENSELLNSWINFTGSDENDLQLAIKQFIETIESEISIIIEEIDMRAHISSGSLAGNT